MNYESWNLDEDSREYSFLDFTNNLKHPLLNVMQAANDPIAPARGIPRKDIEVCVFLSSNYLISGLKVC